MLADRIPEIQQALTEEGADGWLFTGFQKSDPIAVELLGLTERSMITRRCYYLVPREGAPRKLAHRLEPWMLDHLPGDKSLYLSWREHAAGVAALVSGIRRLAVQYSPENQLPTVSRLDAGTAELLRHQGRRAGLLGRAGAALRRDLERRAARRPPARLHAAARDRPRRLRPGGRGARRRPRHRRVHGAALPARALPRRRPVERERPQRLGQRPQRRPALRAGARAAAPRSATATSCSSTSGRRRSGQRASMPTSPGARVCAPSPTTRQQEVFDVVARARDAAWELVDWRYPRASRSAATRSTTRRAGRSRRPATASTSSTAPATRSASPTTARAPTWTTSRPTTRAR